MEKKKKSYVTRRNPEKELAQPPGAHMQSLLCTTGGWMQEKKQTLQTHYENKKHQKNSYDKDANK